LWRVLERSHLIVQIVDARNPLRFRCEDLEEYIQDVEGVEGEARTGKGKRRSMLLINKADFLTARQRFALFIHINLAKHAERYSRSQWANYFDQHHVPYAFYSAANATALQQARREAEKISDTPYSSDESENDANDSDHGLTGEHSTSSISQDDLYFSAEEDEDDRDLSAKILSVVELEEMFLKMAPDPSSKYI
jgi:large subunit GTPase 1